jgi:hypothetical protein
MDPSTTGTNPSTPTTTKSSPIPSSSHTTATEEDWEQLSSASDTADNGTPSARKENEFIARKKREAAFQRDQEQRRKEQREINTRLAEQQKVKEEKRAARREWYSSGGGILQRNPALRRRVKDGLAGLWGGFGSRSCWVIGSSEVRRWRRSFLHT